MLPCAHCWTIRLLLTGGPGLRDVDLSPVFSGVVEAVVAVEVDVVLAVEELVLLLATLAAFLEANEPGMLKSLGDVDEFISWNIVGCAAERCSS